jgi:hypothetical protein
VPDVLLEVDHIEPKAKGGTNSLINLITSCKACNAGKSDRRLSDNAVVTKEREQLRELQQRRQQVEMMFEWQKELAGIEHTITENLAEYWSKLTGGYHLTDIGLTELRKLQRQFDITELMNAMRIAADTYFRQEDGQFTRESVCRGWDKVGGICYVKKIRNPDLERLYRIKGLLRKRLSYFVEWRAMKLLREAMDAGIDLDILYGIASDARNWTIWQETMSYVITEKHRGAGSE